MWFCLTDTLRSPLRSVVDVNEIFWRVSLLRQQPSLRRALEVLGLPFDGAAHTALADARNTARVHAEILRRIRRDTEPTSDKVATASESSRRTLFGEKLHRVLEE